MADEKKVTCIFVHHGYEVDRAEMEHPGMATFKRKWKKAIPKPNKPGEFKMEEHEVEFYWDHMDLNGSHIFRSHEHASLG